MTKVKDFFSNFGSGFLSFFHTLNSRRGFRSFVSGVCCVLIGILAGFILMLCLDPTNCWKGLVVLLSSGFSSATNIGSFISKATPMMLAGLSIAFSFKLGLFNIGITGQLTAGAFVGIVLSLLGANWILSCLLAFLVGGFFGLLTGWLKAKFNVNEVLSGIMLNWIIYFTIGIIGDLAIPSSMKNKIQPDYLSFIPTANRIPSLFPKSTSFSPINMGLIIAIVIIIIFQVILDKTRFGFELKLSGSNKNAAQYAGINQTKNIVVALMMSGAVAGLAGYIVFANPTSAVQFRWSSGGKTLLSQGFDGISVSLIGQNSPMGCILSSLLLTFIDTAQTPLKGVSNVYNIHYTELIKALIIYVASFSSFINMFIQRINQNHNDNEKYLRWMPRQKKKRLLVRSLGGNMND
jgi:general nucleoside transport system permease protein